MQQISKTKILSWWKNRKTKNSNKKYCCFLFNFL